jgi:hypothetical protein
MQAIKQFLRHNWLRGALIALTVFTTTFALGPMLVLAGITALIALGWRVLTANECTCSCAAADDPTQN